MKYLKEELSEFEIMLKTKGLAEIEILHILILFCKLLTSNIKR